MKETKSLFSAYYDEARRVNPFRNEKFDASKVTDWIAEYRRVGSAELKDLIIYSGLFWVVKLANMFCQRYDLMEHKLDLIQEGNLGLIHALRLYKPEFGSAYSTYATHWIKNYMARYAMNQIDLIRRPVHRHEQIKRLKRMIFSIDNELGIDSDKELEKQQQSLQAIHEFEMQSNGKSISLSQPLKEDSNTEAHELLFVSQYRMSSIIDSINTNELMEKCRRFLYCRYEKRDVDIFLKRLDMENDSETLETLGQQYNITRERVRQINKRICEDPNFRWFFYSILDEKSKAKVAQLLNNSTEHSETGITPAPTVFPESDYSTADLELLNKVEIEFELPAGSLRRKHSRKSPTLQLGYFAATWLLYHKSDYSVEDIARVLKISYSSAVNYKKNCFKIMETDENFSDSVTKLLEK